MNVILAKLLLLKRDIKPIIMAQYNQNNENPGYNSYSNRDQNRTQFRNQDSYQNMENEYGFGNASSANRNTDYNERETGFNDSRFNTGRISNHRNQQENSNYNKVNYLPDNDDNQNYNQQDLERSNYGSGENRGYRGEFGQNFNSRNEHTNQGEQNFSNMGYGNLNTRNEYSSQYGNKGMNTSNQRDFNQYNESNSPGYRPGNQNWQHSNLNNDYYPGNFRQMDVYSTDHDKYSNRHQGHLYNSPYNYNREFYNDSYQNVGRNFSGEDYPYRGNQMNRNSNYGNQSRDRNWWERTKDKVSSWFDEDDHDSNRRYDPSYSHRGKGPKGYARSADRIREDVCDRLTDDDRIDASEIHIDIQGRDVILTGTVHSREEKRRAEDLVESISGVDNVENRLRIDRGTDRGHDYTGTTDKLGGIGSESGTTNEIIRNTGNKRKDL